MTKENFLKNNDVNKKLPQIICNQKFTKELNVDIK